MASTKDSLTFSHFAWIIGDNLPDISDNVIEQMKNIGPMWGSPAAWRNTKVDNVVVIDVAIAKSLLQRAFQSVCNLYLPTALNAELGRPLGVRWFDGEFPRKFDGQDTMTAMLLASGISNTCLVYGVQVSESVENKPFVDAFIRLVEQRPLVQWVILADKGQVSERLLQWDNVFVEDSSLNVVIEALTTESDEV